MAERSELFEATLSSMTEAVAIISPESVLVYWNPAAESLTGFSSVELVGRPLPENLDPILHTAAHQRNSLLGEGVPSDRGSLMTARHKLGQEMRVMTRQHVLRSGTGERVGTAILFHSSENMAALPHGEAGQDTSVESSQAELEERLLHVYNDYVAGGPSFGVLWICVDQAAEMRKTHGAGACEEMLSKVSRALANGLRPGEELGRWGREEFLIISQEPSLEMLEDHAQKLAGQARTADFRWWGDRVSLTVSIGVARISDDEKLAIMLERAKAAMFTSFHAGGNQITTAPGGQACSQS